MDFSIRSIKIYVTLPTAVATLNAHLMDCFIICNCKKQLMDLKHFQFMTAIELTYEIIVIILFFLNSLKSMNETEWVGRHNMLFSFLHSFSDCLKVIYYHFNESKIDVFTAYISQYSSSSFHSIVLCTIE